MTTVTIVGCGALGSLFAARLLEAGLRVQALQRPGPQLEALCRDGIWIRGDRTGTDRHFALTAAAARAEELEPARLAIVLVKSYHTQDLDRLAALLALGGAVLSLQNGAGNAELLSAFVGGKRVAAGTATYGAHRISPGVIAWGGDGRIVLGPWQAGQDMSWITKLLCDAGLNANYVEDPRPALWRKLAINAMVNTVTALARVRNGQTLESPWSIDVMQRLGREAVIAAGRAGVPLDFDEVWSLQEENLRRTAANRTSMLQDVEGGRRTEVDAILGTVLRYAENDQDLPTTRAVYGLLKTIEDFRDDSACAPS